MRHLKVVVRLDSSQELSAKFSRWCVTVFTVLNTVRRSIIVNIQGVMVGKRSSRASKGLSGTNAGYMSRLTSQETNLSQTKDKLTQSKQKDMIDKGRALVDLAGLKSCIYTVCQK